MTVQTRQETQPVSEALPFYDFDLFVICMYMHVVETVGRRHSVYRR